jgi:hypothetical protein
MAQLEAFAGDSPRDWFLEIRSTLARGGMAQEFVRLGELDRAREIIEARSCEQDTYVGVAPRSRQSGKAEAVQHSHVLWVDLDDPVAAAESLPGFDPPPHLLIRSGSGVHAYWRLTKPLDALFVRRANLRLAVRLGGDTNACDPARIMRPVGSLNHKHDPPRQVRCLKHLTTPFAYTVSDVVGGLIDHQRYQPRPAVARSTRTGPVNPNSVIEGACRVVREAADGERNSCLNWAAYRLGERVALGELYEDVVEGSLLRAAIDAGLPSDEALRTIVSGLNAAAGRGAR